MEKQQSRDHYIDFLRGLAALNIIMIHTTFWSGSSYVPEVVQSISLSLDVPFFFFLSGISTTYVGSFQKSLRSLLQVYKKYLMFLPVYFIFLLIVGRFSGNYAGISVVNLYPNLFFIKNEGTVLPVVMGSMWFLPVYFIVLPLGSFLFQISRKWSQGNTGEEKRWIEQIFFVAMVGLLYTYLEKTTFIGISSRTLFYLLFFLLGTLCRTAKIKHFHTVILLALLDIAVMKCLGIYFGWDISNIQSMKFPPNIIYFLYSLLSVSVALWGRGKCRGLREGNILCRIGRSAIWFYFCQGISSSLLYFIRDLVQLPWYVKLLALYAINLTLCLLLVLGVQKIWDALSCLLKTHGSLWFKRCLNHKSS